VILPLAHHNAVAALPVFAPAIVICLVLLVHFLRERRRWDEEPESGADDAAGSSS
jgi:ABC-type transport system involved in cytochrome c biogenesis permease component